MKIVTDDMVTTALEYLASDPHPLAQAEFELADAKNHRDQLFAELFSNSAGKSVKDRECEVECDPLYQDARKKEAEAIMLVARHKARRLWADKITELWRTDNANQRAAERVR